jgi:putative protease
VELLEEWSEELCGMLRLYRDLISGELTGRVAWVRLKSFSRVGVPRGTWEERRQAADDIPLPQG